MVKSTIGNRVSFDEGRVRGTVEDEVLVLEEYDDKDFLDLIQYIRWDGGEHSIRFCYYVRQHGTGEKNWIFANRALSIGSDELVKLLKKAEKKTWFKLILDQL